MANHKRIIFMDNKNQIEEPSETFPSLISAISELNRLINENLIRFGQVLDFDGRVLANRANIKALPEPETEQLSA